MDPRDHRPHADWVFGYGSLIWDPEFDHDQSMPGRLHGYHRAFCIGSVHYRGTPEAPGVVLGLDRGGSCTGVAFHLRGERRRESLDRLYAREMLGGVYRPTLASVTLRDGRRVRALAFVADRASPDYLRLDEGETVRRLHACAGSRGANRDYALETWRALREHGIRDGRLDRLCRTLISDTSGNPTRQCAVDPPMCRRSALVQPVTFIPSDPAETDARLQPGGDLHITGSRPGGGAP